MTGADAFYRLALIGRPVRQSLSPVIHGYFLEQAGLRGTYDLIDCGADELPAVIDDLCARGYHGFNVTAPHKRAVMKYCAGISDTAAALGAVNSVRIKDGRLYGDNTDADGFLQGLRRYDADLACLRGGALVIGAGGAARAVYGALRAAAQEAGLAGAVKICARRDEQAAEIAQDESAVMPWAMRATRRWGLIVNASSGGMAGMAALEIDGFDFGAFVQDGQDVRPVICDIVYKPLRTDLLRAADDSGAVTVDGLWMLLYQAARAFALWTGVVPVVDDELRALVLRGADDSAQKAAS